MWWIDFIITLQEDSPSAFFADLGEFLVFLLDDVVIMRAGADDLFHAIGFEVFQVLRNQGMEKIFVAAPKRRVAGISFFRSQYADFNAGFLHYLEKRGRDFLVPLVVRSGGADKIEIINLRVLSQWSSLRGLQAAMRRVRRKRNRTD